MPCSAAAQPHDERKDAFEWVPIHFYWSLLVAGLSRCASSSANWSGRSGTNCCSMRSWDGLGLHGLVLGAAAARCTAGTYTEQKPPLLVGTIQSASSSFTSNVQHAPLTHQKEGSVFGNACACAAVLRCQSVLSGLPGPFQDRPQCSAVVAPKYGILHVCTAHPFVVHSTPASRGVGALCPAQCGARGVVLSAGLPRAECTSGMLCQQQMSLVCSHAEEGT